MGSRTLPKRLKWTTENSPDKRPTEDPAIIGITKMNELNSIIIAQVCEAVEASKLQTT